MDDLDNAFADDDFDLIGILEKAELEYSNTQQQRLKNYNNNPTTGDINTNANTTSLVQHNYNIEQQQQYTNGDNRFYEPESSTNSRSNWDPVVHTSDDFGFNEMTNNAGITAATATDYLHFKRKQDMELEQALRDAARLRSTLAFKNQELKNTQMELRDIKAKLQQDELKKENDMMEIDQPSPSPASTQCNQDPGFRNTQNSSRRNSPFPSKWGFTGNQSVKRQRTSALPSPGPILGYVPRPQPKVEPPPPDRSHEIETRQQREMKQAAFDRAVNAKVANHLAIVKQDIEQQRLIQKESDAQAFYQCLAQVKFVKLHSDTASMRRQLEPQELHIIIANGLRPTKMVAGSDSTLNLLASDISACISQVTTIGIKATLSQIFLILRSLIQLCIQDCKHITFIRAVDLTFTLFMHYSSYINTHLQQEISGAGDQTILHFLTKGLLMIPIQDADEGPNKHSIIRALPDIANMNYTLIKDFLHGYSFGPSDIRELLTGVTPFQAQETTSMVLKILSNLSIGESKIKNPGLSNRFLFLLDQKGFTDLISLQKPMAIVHEAIYLIQSLVVKGNTDWLHNEKYDPLLKTISSFMKMSRPSEHLELQWYHLKLAAIRTFDRILTIVPVPLSPEDTLELALYPSIYTLNNECLRVQDGNKPPYESVPKNESDILLAEVVSLMYKSLLVHPVLLDYPSNVKGDDDDEDSVYLQTIISLKRLEQIMDLSLEAKRLVRPTLAKLTQLINQKDSLMASAPRSS